MRIGDVSRRRRLMNDDRAIFYAGYRTARLNKLSCERNRDEVVAMAATYFRRRVNRKEASIPLNSSTII